MKWLMVFVMGVLAGVMQTTVFCADTIVDSYTKAGLPAAGTAGRIARVTDDVRGLWMDQGSKWFSLSGETVNVKEFGAVGDNVNDDTTAIQNAINALPTAGGIVLLPPGVYKVTATLTFKANTIFQGSGVSDAAGNALGSMIVGNLTSAILAPATPNSPTHHVVVRNLTINNTTSAKVGGIGIDFRNVNESIISDIRIMNVQTGIRLRGDANGFYNVLENVRMSFIATGIDAADNANDITVIGGRMDRFSSNGILLRTLGGFRISDMAFESFPLDAIGINVEATTSAIRIFGNLFESGGTGIKIAAGAVGIVTMGNRFMGLQVNHISNSAGVETLSIEPQVPTTALHMQRLRLTHNTGAANVALHGAKTDTVQVVNDAGTDFRDLQARALIVNEGISATATTAKNLRGSVTISGTSTAGSVTFGVAEVNASYFITVTPTAVTGSPAAGSNSIKSISKTATGFTVTLDAAPGNGNSRTFDWHLIR